MKKQCQRDLKSHGFGVQNGTMGFPESTYPLIFDVLGGCQQIIIFERPPDGPKNQAV